MLLIFLLATFCFSFDLSSKITGGDVVKSALKYPFLVDIQKTFEISDTSSILLLHCMAVFLPPSSILTAAHCSYANGKVIGPKDLENYFVFGNRLNRSDPNSPGTVTFKVDSIIIHPLYNDTQITYDAAIWKVSLISGSLSSFPTNLVLDSDISSKSWYGKQATISGFGALFGDPQLQTEVLLDAQVPIITNQECLPFYKEIEIHSSWICAGNATVRNNTMTGTCFGDSGGPLFVINGDIVTLIGIVSSSSTVKCGHQPDVFTKIAVMRNWILDNTAGGGAESVGDKFMKSGKNNLLAGKGITSDDAGLKTFNIMALMAVIMATI
jgi:secreted trypsin-like serine protease